MDWIDKLLQDAQKEMQKLEITMIGMTANMIFTNNEVRLVFYSKTQIDNAKESISRNSSDLKDAIKGQFADKVSEVLENRKTLLNDISKINHG